MIIEIIGIPDEVLKKKAVAKKYKLNGKILNDAVADLRRIDEAMTGKIRKKEKVMAGVEIWLEISPGKFEDYWKLPKRGNTEVAENQNVQFRPVLVGPDKEDKSEEEERSDAFDDLLKVHPIMEKKAKKESRYKLTNIKHWKLVRIAKTKCKDGHDWKITNPGASEKIGAICTRCTINVTVSLQEMAEYGTG